MSLIKEAQRHLLSLEVKLGRAGIVLERERNLCGLPKGSEFNSSGLMSYKSVSAGCRSVISTPSPATLPSDHLSTSPCSEISPIWLTQSMEQMLTYVRHMHLCAYVWLYNIKHLNFFACQFTTTLSWFNKCADQTLNFLSRLGDKANWLHV